MNKPNITWQGIGISSNPFQKDEPLSLHLQTYLRESANSANEHLIVIADEMQVSNYQSLYGISESKARKIALKKGRKKQKSIEKIIEANGLDNVRVLRFNEVMRAEQINTLNQLRDLYNSNSEVKKAVIDCVPKRLLDKANNVDEVANYVLTEIGLILSIPAIKFGHENERAYDNLALQIHSKFGIGKKPEFSYSKTPLEFISDNGLKVEPYSAILTPKRLLLTDSLSAIKGKIDGISNKASKKLEAQLKNAGLMDGESISEFYERAIAPVRYALDAPNRMLRRITLGLTTGLSALVLTGAYINHDANKIRQDHMNNLTIFALNGDMKTCERAMNQEISKTNEEIREKYHIDNYFRGFG